MSNFKEDTLIDLSLLFKLVLKYRLHLTFYFAIALFFSLIRFYNTDSVYKSTSTILVSSCYSNNSQLTFLTSNTCNEFDYIVETFNSIKLFNSFINFANSDSVLSELKTIKAINDSEINFVSADLIKKYLKVDLEVPKYLIKISFLSNYQDEVSILANAFSSFGHHFIVSTMKNKYQIVSENLKNKKFNSNYSKEIAFSLERNLNNQIVITEVEAQSFFEIIDYAIKPNARFKPSLRLSLAQDFIIAISLLLLIYISRLIFYPSKL